MSVMKAVQGALKALDPVINMAAKTYQWRLGLELNKVGEFRLSLMERGAGHLTRSNQIQRWQSVANDDWMIPPSVAAL